MLWVWFHDLYILLIFFSDEEKGKKMWAKYLGREDSKIVGKYTLHQCYLSIIYIYIFFYILNLSFYFSLSFSNFVIILSFLYLFFSKFSTWI